MAALREKWLGLDQYPDMFYGENLIVSNAKIKLLICNSSDLRIKHVSIKMDAFQRDLRIHGLCSSIGATVQKVNF
jgi:hypothetical protein